MSDAHFQAPKPALVVFVDLNGCTWLHGLRRGFRHCFAVLRDCDAWLACDSLKDRIELFVLPVAADIDLASFYRAQGHRVLIGTTQPMSRRRSFSIAPLTCVTVVKRLLGVRAPWVLTPWQLFRHLERDGRRFVEPKHPLASDEAKIIATNPIDFRLDVQA
jgi:hypothetical protein